MRIELLLPRLRPGTVSSSRMLCARASAATERQILSDMAVELDMIFSPNSTLRREVSLPQRRPGNRAIHCGFVETFTPGLPHRRAWNTRAAAAMVIYLANEVGNQASRQPYDEGLTSLSTVARAALQD